jgi:hypothetical protein
VNGYDDDDDLIFVPSSHETRSNSFSKERDYEEDLLKLSYDEEKAVM